MPLLDLPQRLVTEARLYAVHGISDVDAVCHVLDDYGNVIGELRILRNRVAQLDDEGAQLDARIDALQAACRAILQL